MHAAVVFKRDELLVEQRIDMRREHQPVVTAQTFDVGCFAPGFDVAGDQQAGVSDAGDATYRIEQNHLLAEGNLGQPGPG